MNNDNIVHFDGKIVLSCLSLLSISIYRFCFAQYNSVFSTFVAHKSIENRLNTLKLIIELFLIDFCLSHDCVHSFLKLDMDYGKWNPRNYTNRINRFMFLLIVYTLHYTIHSVYYTLCITHIFAFLR